MAIDTCYKKSNATTHTSKKLYITTQTKTTTHIKTKKSNTREREKERNNRLTRQTSSGNAGLCRQIVQTSQMRDVEWATSSCTLTFNTLGIWPEGADGTDVNTCTRANNDSVLVTGDDFGKVKVFSNPACFQKVSGDGGGERE